MEKEQFRGTESSIKISHLSFGVPNSTIIRRQSHIQCINNQLYENNEGPVRKSALYGVLDERLGTSQKGSNCSTCGQQLADCVGHFGYIDLALPVFHVGYFRFIQAILQCVCKKCSRFLLWKERDVILSRLRKPDLSYLEKKAIYKDIITRSKKIKECVHCAYINGTVKKVGFQKILHVFPPTKASDKSDSLSDEVINLINALQIDGDRDAIELIDLLKKSKAEILDPITVKLLFEQIPDQDLPLLLINNFRPEDLIITRVTVPPACIRPSVISEVDASTEDDLTVQLSEIIFISEVISKRIATGVQMSGLVEVWDYLQMRLAIYINSEISGIPYNQKPRKPMRGLVQRLKGKHGRFRGNLSGKRVDFSSRSVISPNPNLAIDEVGVPEYIAKILTFPERVTPHNIGWLGYLVENGAEKHPGANFIQHADGQKKFLRFSNRSTLAKNLKCGDIVERHLVDGDKVLFNRQPSLHKLSIMCHTARVHKHRTLQFNECVCTPYNADFDGDEMNLHLPQTLEARAEASVLMGIKSNIVTPRNGEPLISAIQDFITGGFLMTHKDTFFDRAQAMQLISNVLSTRESASFIDLPPPCIVRPKALWSGKQVFSMIIVPNKASRKGVCLESKTKNYSGRDKDLCVNDGYIILQDGELLCGTLDKTILGSGSKTNVFYVMLRDVSCDESADAMWRLARVTSFFMANRGFSLGIDDVTPTTGLLEDKNKLLSSGYSNVQGFIDQHRNAKLEAQPGQTVEETLEMMILKELSGIRDSAGKTCIQELGNKNAPLLMAMCGSKGSLINVSQMVACVGQQAIRGARVPDGFGDRSLPYFDHREKTPLAKGFVENSFYSGLTATEFFFHTMAGREGLLDTAVKTAETGYMQRRLVKALEDLVTHYDGTVRNSRGEMIQFVYGDDYMDPVNMEDNDKPVNFNRLLSHVRSLYPCMLEEPLKPNEIMTYVKDEIEKLAKEEENYSRNIEEPAAKRMQLTLKAFRDEILDFFSQMCQRQERYRKAIPRDRYDTFLTKQLDWKLPAFQSIDRITRKQLEIFFEKCLDKRLKAIIEPGTAVGAICAQSIGEPATQMTLKTFHFAGVASMNITQGVPRIKELINANKTISTPIIRAYLHNPEDDDYARSVKMRLEKTTLGQISKYIDQIIFPDDCFCLVQLFEERIKLLKLEITEESVCECISKQLKIPNDVTCIKPLGRGQISVRPKAPTELWRLRGDLAKVIVKGVKTIKRAAIRIEDDGTHYLMIEGEGLRDVIATHGVNPNKTISNNVLEVAATLGVEAARTTIIKEIKETMNNHGISIDNRHLMLLADTMTYRGEVLGITRFGLAKMKESALMLASFEKTADHLFDAAYFNQKDAIVGVSEAIISGVAMRVGTGFFDLLHKPSSQTTLKQKKPLFDDESLHELFRYSTS